MDQNRLKSTFIFAAMGPARDLRGTKEEQDTAMGYIKGIINVKLALGLVVISNLIILLILPSYLLHQVS